MSKRYFVILLSAVWCLTSYAQKAGQATNCKCNYPFKPECSTYCIKTLVQGGKLKQAMVNARLADSTRAKLEKWSAGADANQGVETVLTRRELARLNVALQSFSDDPANRENSSSRFLHSFGATLSSLFGKDKYGNNFSLLQTNVCYFPRINISQSENASVSIGAPVGIGIGIATNTLGSDAGVAFAYDLPVVVDYNFGCKATRNVRKNFGGYVGAGFGYYHVSISQSSYSNFTGTTYGPMGRAGIRFAKEDWNNKAVTVGLFYKKGLEAAKLNTIGFNVLADF